MKLFEINAEIQYCLDKAIDLETGEVIDTNAFNRLELLEIEQEEKALDIACYIKGLRADAAALKDESKKLSERAAVETRKADRIEKYLAATIGSETKYKDSRAVISWRKSDAVNVLPDAVDKLPVDLQRIKVEANKTAIKEILKSGGTVAGCELVTKQNIQIK